MVLSWKEMCVYDEHTLAGQDIHYQAADAGQDTPHNTLWIILTIVLLKIKFRPGMKILLSVGVANRRNCLFLFMVNEQEAHIITGKIFFYEWMNMFILVLQFYKVSDKQNRTYEFDSEFIMIQLVTFSAPCVWWFIALSFHVILLR